MIIKCKECQAEVSDSAAFCQNCGISFPGITEQMGEAIESDSKYRAWLYIPGVLFFGSILAVIYDGYIANAIGEDVAIVVGESAKLYAPYAGIGMMLYIMGEVWRGISIWARDRKLRVAAKHTTNNYCYQGYSYDNKPIDVRMGSEYYEVDTGKYYVMTINGWMDKRDETISRS